MHEITAEEWGKAHYEKAAKDDARGVIDWRMCQILGVPTGTLFTDLFPNPHTPPPTSQHP